VSLEDRQAIALNEAVLEARRFIKAAESAFAEKKKGMWQCVYSAAAKRASLDLTRALARFRKA
jgi:hypothetical protein